jgi:hypothetical protein
MTLQIIVIQNVQKYATEKHDPFQGSTSELPWNDLLNPQNSWLIIPERNAKHKS